METIRCSIRAESSRPTLRVTSLLLGALTGPAFLTVAVAQMLLRSGFDITVHPISALSLGEAGWVQSANFVVAGLLTVVAATALHRRMRDTVGGTWGPLLVGLFGFGLALAGVFPTDPA